MHGSEGGATQTNELSLPLSTVPYWIIPKELVRNWWAEAPLGKPTKISRQKALSLVKVIT